MNHISRYFALQERGTTLGRELRGGVATFLTMAYILLANPAILAAAGAPPVAVATATALAAGLACLFMGVYANFPLALASGMGLNAFLAFTLVPAMGSWQAAMGMVVVEGIVILLLVLAGLREAVLHAIPRDLRLAIGGGIGLFIAFIGLRNGGFVVGSPATLVTFGDVTAKQTLVAGLGFAVMAALLIRRVPGAILLGIAAACALAAVLGLVDWPDAMPRPDFSTLFAADVTTALQPRFLTLLLPLIMVDFFDTLGTVTAVAQEAGLADEKGRVPKLRRILIVDSAAASLGGLFGASSVTSYVESAAGVAEGARTGLHTVIVGVLFLVAVLLAPFAALVPAAATAPALVLVGFLMLLQVRQIDFDNWIEAIPAFVILITIPLTFSIAHGIGYGFLAYVLIHTFALRPHKVHPLMWASAAVFVVMFWFERPVA